MALAPMINLHEDFHVHCIFVVDFACVTGNSYGKWPIRNFCRLDLNVNGKDGGCAALVLCSNSYGGKGEETSAEVFLFRGNSSDMRCVTRK